MRSQAEETANVLASNCAHLQVGDVALQSSRNANIATGVASDMQEATLSPSPLSVFNRPFSRNQQDLSTMVELRSLALECVAEFVGTFVLVFLGTAGIASAAFTTPGGLDMALEHVSLGWGLATALSTYLVAPASGAHLNPAVTLAIAVSKHDRSGFERLKTPAYIFAQLLGATCGGIAVLLTFGRAITRFEERMEIQRGEDNSALSAVAFGASFPHPQLVYGTNDDSTLWGEQDVSVWGAMCLEALGTMIFVLIQRAVRRNCQLGSPDTIDRVSLEDGCAAVELPAAHFPACPLAGIYIGMAHAALSLVTTPFTQACLNPARDFGPRVVATIAGWGSAALPGVQANACWVYLVGPTVGAVVGALVFDSVLHPGMITEGEKASAWLRRQQEEGDAILEHLEKRQTLMSVTGFEAVSTGKGLHHSDFRESPTPHNYRLSSPGRLAHTYTG